MNSDGIVALVLAGGMSERMGACKYLLPFGEESVLGHILGVVASVPEISWLGVVTGHFKQELAPVLQNYRATEIENPDYRMGEMLSSVQAGVRALPKGATGLLLLLGDQPLITPELLRQILQVAEETKAPLVQPQWEGKRGHPIFIASECFAEIRELPPDATLKCVVSRREAQRRFVSISDASILQDIDTPTEYQNLLSLFIGRSLHVSR